MQKLKWNKWESVSDVPLNSNILVETPQGYRTAIFTKKRGVVVGEINGAYWFDQKILRWADLEVVL